MSVIYPIVLYGKKYIETFIEIQLPSLVTQTTYDYIKKSFKFFIYTNKATIEDDYLRERISLIKEFLNVEFFVLPNLPREEYFENRYKHLVISNDHAAEAAIESGAYLSFGLATQVFAADFFENALNKIQSHDYDAILQYPIRALAENFRNFFPEKYSPIPAEGLLTYCVEHLSPSLIASNWDQPYATTEKFVLTWNSGRQHVLRSLGFTPCIFKPDLAAKEQYPNLTADLRVAATSKNPYLALDYHELPTANLMHLQRYYQFFENRPFFGQRRNTIEDVANWLVNTSIFQNKDYKSLHFMLNTQSVYKSKYESIDLEIMERSNETALKIKDYIYSKFGMRF